MKTVNLSLLRSVIAAAIGLVLVFWSQSAVVYLIMSVGFLFFIPGIVAVISYIQARREEGRRLSVWTQVIGIGSSLFGLSLVVYPVAFERSLMYALGAILVYAGLSEVVHLVKARQWAHVAGGYYVVPLFIVALGIFILFNPIGSANIPFILLGIGCLVYSISNLINLLKFRDRTENSTEEAASLLEAGQD